MKTEDQSLSRGTDLSKMSECKEKKIKASGLQKQIWETLRVKYGPKFSWLEALHFAMLGASWNKTAKEFCQMNGL